MLIDELYKRKGELEKRIEFEKTVHAQATVANLKKELTIISLAIAALKQNINVSLNLD